MSGNEIDPAVVEAWRAAYAAVYGCEITHPAYMYGNAYPIIQGYGDQRVAQSVDRIAELEARVKLLEDVADAADNVVQNLPMFPLHASVRVLTRRLAALNPSARSE